MFQKLVQALITTSVFEQAIHTANGDLQRCLWFIKHYWLRCAARSLEAEKQAKEASSEISRVPRELLSLGLQPRLAGKVIDQQP